MTPSGWKIQNTHPLTLLLLPYAQYQKNIRSDYTDKKKKCFHRIIKSHLHSKVKWHQFKFMWKTLIFAYCLRQ